MYKLILAVTLLQQLLLQTECLFSGDSCVVENDFGSCLPLLDCKPVVDEIRKAGNPIPPFMRKKLQKLTCGFNFHEPMVCCVSSGDDSNWGTHNHVVTVPTNVVTPTQSSNSPDSIHFGGSGTTNKDDNVEAFTRANVDTKNGPRDITRHPNLKLLPTNICGVMEGDRIWGGNRTRLYEMPWMVLLSYASSRGTKLSCGGTIITENYILTAAHCVSFLSSNLRLDGIVIGEYDVRKDPDCEMLDGQEFCAPPVMNGTIASVLAHPGYTPQTLTDDIALIRLSQPANFTLNSVKPICLPMTRELQMQTLPGLNGVVAGWGVTEDGLQSPVLLSVDLPIVSPKDCMTAYNNSLRISNTQVCAGGVKDKDSCGGDSGGPLMYPGILADQGVRYIQRGIVSFGSRRCGIAGYPGVYTNVAYYMDWILDNISS